MNPPSPAIQVRNAQRRMRVAIAPLQEFATSAFERCRALPGADVSWMNEGRAVEVTLISDRRMAELHQQFMNISGPTDVLTFHHGEIVVSVETAQENARRFGTSPEHEIRLYLVHGFLHLLGFDDRTKAGSRQMETLQSRVLRDAQAPCHR